MKEETIKDFKVISNSNLSQFEREVKAFLDEHQNAVSINVNSSTTTEGHYAHVLWEEKILVPEDIKDEYILRGENYRCENCPYWGKNGSDNHRDAFECLRRVRNRVRGCEDACLHFYQKLAEGEIRPYEP